MNNSIVKIEASLTDFAYLLKCKEIVQSKTCFIITDEHNRKRYIHVPKKNEVIRVLEDQIKELNRRCELLDIDNSRLRLDLRKAEGQFIPEIKKLSILQFLKLKFNKK